MRTKFKGILTLLLAFVVQLTFAQEKTVTGTVVDGDGLPIPGVNVIVKGTSTGTQTNFDGEFAVSASSDQTLVFSYVGFTTQEIKVGTQTTINLTLKPNLEELKEVVVTAYGSTTKINSSQAVQTISSEGIENRTLASPIQSLQGQVAGLGISTLSGQPGANSTIILRGIGSINGNFEPLILLDGVPIDEDNLRSINQNDIANISVLKDAAATSIYGNRGSGGVIVINTKKGNFEESMQINYVGQYGFSEIPNLNIDVMNSREKLEFQRGLNVGLGAGLTDAEITAFANRTNTDWTDVLFRTAETQQHNLSITSGSKNTRSYTSLGYLNQEGTFLASKLQRFSFRNNFDGKSDDGKFNYSTSFTANFAKADFDPAAESGSRSTFFNPFFQAIRGNPLVSPFDPDGSITSDGGITPGDAAAITGDNIRNQPIVLLNSALLNVNRDEEIKLVGNFRADYTFLDNFNVGVNVGMDFESIKNEDLLNPNSILGPFQTDVRAQFGGLEDQSYLRDFNFNFNASLKYNNTFGDKHTVGAALFTEYIKNHLEGFNFRAVGLDPRQLGSGGAFIAGTVTEDLDGDGTAENPYIDTIGKTNLETGLYSYFGTIDYDYDGKYGFYASVRRDASVRFTEDERWGTFWSVSGRWNISEEDFMSDSKFNLLKLRASYGTTGNERISGGRYGALDLFRNTYTTGQGYNGGTALVPNNIANTTLTWETSNKANIGIDFAVNNNKLQGNIDFYNEETEDLFNTVPISGVNATTGISANVGSLVNRGFETTLNYTLVDTKDWFLRLTANISYNDNEITELPGADENGIIRGGGSTALGEGQPIRSFFVQRYAGVNPSNGNPLFLTADGDLTETLVDADRVYVDKSAVPFWQGGFGFNLQYKGFGLTTQFVWFGDHYRNNLDIADLEGNPSITGGNSAASLLRAWQMPGDITDIPRINGPISTIDMFNQTDRFIENASYLRLRNVTLGYTFTDEMLKKTPFSSARVFAQAENPLTFTSFRAFDPEGAFAVTNNSQFPTPIIITFGVNVNF
jgi:TonB-linked SusC/RagA family outer membrane protein